MHIPPGIPPGPPSLILAGGVQIYVSPFLVERVPYPRSPARAKRRAKLGHPQHMVERPSRTAYVLNSPDPAFGLRRGDVLVMHPVMLDNLKARMRLDAERAGGDAAAPDGRNHK